MNSTEETTTKLKKTREWPCGHDTFYTLPENKDTDTRHCKVCKDEVFPFGIKPVVSDPNDVVYIDVDFTLISPLDVQHEYKCSVNWLLVKQIEKWHKAGRTIVIWTSNMGGVEYAKRAAELCQITNFVHDYKPKPRLIVDDDHLEYYRTMDPVTMEIREAGKHA